MCTLEATTFLPELGLGTRILDMFGDSGNGPTAVATTQPTKQQAKAKRSKLADPLQHKLKSDTPPCWTMLEQEQGNHPAQKQQQAYLQASWLNIWSSGPEP